MNAVQIAKRDVLEMIVRYPVFGRVLANCEFLVMDETDAIAVNDCKRVFLSSQRYPALDFMQRMAVLVHESLHILLKHAFRKGARDEKLFGFSCDAEISFILEDMNLTYPVEMDVDPGWRTLTAEQIYDLLEAEDDTDSESPHCFSPSDSSEADTKDNTESSSGTDANSTNNELDDVEETGDETKTAGPRTDSDAEEFCNDILHMLTLTDGAAGDVPGALSAKIEPLREVKVNWRSLLRQYLRQCRDGSYKWLPPNRRFVARNIYIPSRSGKVFRAVVALDTSGSIGRYLTDFLSELHGILRAFGNFQMTIIACNVCIQLVKEINARDGKFDVSQLDFRSGGGTDFRPVFEYIEKNIQNPNILMYFTDGCGPCVETKPAYPVLWILTPDGKAPVGWGASIYYEKN